jgi:hypothetical protein
MRVEPVSVQNHVMTTGESSPGCPRCGGAPTVGVLCGRCAPLAPVAEGLIPAHISSVTAAGDAAAWLIDGFGVPHPVGPGRTVIGRMSDSHLVILSASVSRAHAARRRTESGDWELRDLGSRNRTLVDGKRLAGRAPVAPGALVRVGEIGFVFHVGPAPVVAPAQSLATAHARGEAERFVVRGPGVELCVVGGEAGGVLLARRGDADWTEVTLAPLELQLLRILCARAIEDAGSPSRTRGCVPSKQLVSKLPFATDYATEENVRKLVQRARAALAAAGITGLVETVPTRGYYVAWSVGLD